MDGQDYTTDLSDYDGDIGPCKSCLYEEELDNAGLCAGCNPISEDTRAILIALLSPVDFQPIKEAVNASGNN